MTSPVATGNPAKLICIGILQHGIVWLSVWSVLQFCCTKLHTVATIVRCCRGCIKRVGQVCRGGLHCERLEFVRAVPKLWKRHKQTQQQVTNGSWWRYCSSTLSLLVAVTALSASMVWLTAANKHFIGMNVWAARIWEPHSSPWHSRLKTTRPVKPDTLHVSANFQQVKTSLPRFSQQMQFLGQTGLVLLVALSCSYWLMFWGRDSLR